MHKARQGKELVLRTANDIDALAKLSKIVAERGANILAMSCSEEGSDAVMRLVTDDTLRTTDAETGLLQWSEYALQRKPDLVQRVAEYFEGRREDE